MRLHLKCREETLQIGLFEQREPQEEKPCQEQKHLFYRLNMGNCSPPPSPILLAFHHFPLVTPSFILKLFSVSPLHHLPHHWRSNLSPSINVSQTLESVQNKQSVTCELLFSSVLVRLSVISSGPASAGRELIQMRDGPMRGTCWFTPFICCCFYTVWASSDSRYHSS